MTFYQELKEFFKTNDPARLYMANKIARKFRLGTEQKVVLNRLKVIYENGGPSEIVLGPPAPVTSGPTVETEVSDIVNEIVEEEIAEALRNSPNKKQNSGELADERLKKVLRET